MTTVVQNNYRLFSSESGFKSCCKYFFLYIAREIKSMMKMHRHVLICARSFL